MSPVYTKVHSRTGEKTVLGITPDETGVFTLFDGSPIEQDFSQIGKERVEQLLRINAPAIGNLSFYLSAKGEGSRHGTRPQGVFNTYNLEVKLHQPIREAGQWRRI